MWTFRHKLGGLVTWLAPSADGAGVLDRLSSFFAQSRAPSAADSRFEADQADSGAAPIADEVHRQDPIAPGEGPGAVTEPHTESGGSAGDAVPVSSGSPRRAPDDATEVQAAIAQPAAPQFANQGPPEGAARAAAQSDVAAPAASANPAAPNAAPTDIVVTGGTVDENSAAGTVVATLEAVDADPNESFTFSLVDGDASPFEIKGDQIVVRDGADLDYETTTSHSVDVRVTDSAGNTYTETVAIAVEDVADTAIIGTIKADTLVGTDGAEIIQGLDGDDFISAAGGDDIVLGNRGADKLIGGVGDDTVDGGSGSDSLYGGAGNDTMYGGSAINGKNSEIGGNDSLFGEAGDDVLDGGDGDDSLHGGDGNDTLYGGSGNGALNGKNAQIGGNDTLFGHAGDDVLDGGDGDDTLSGGDGDDVLIGGVGADDLDGDDGTDTASYAESNAAVTVDLATGTGTGGDAQGDTLAQIENLTGSDHDDVLTGDTGDNVLMGGAGDDVLSGGDGVDTLIGAAGDDTIHGGGGNDVINGGLGNDTMFGEAGDDLFIAGNNGPATSSWVDGGAGSDTLDLSGVSEGWTVVLDNGDTFGHEDTFDSDLLSDDAGVVSFEDGAEITFQDIENLTW